MFVQDEITTRLHLLGSGQCIFRAGAACTLVSTSKADVCRAGSAVDRLATLKNRQVGSISMYKCMFKIRFSFRFRLRRASPSYRDSEPSIGALVACSWQVYDSG